MVRARRLLSVIIAFALTQFGVLATAPAHAHADGAGHGVREMVVAHGHAHVDSGHAVHHHAGSAGHHEDDHHDDLADTDASPAPDSPAPDSNDIGHGEDAMHVHACPQFAPVEGGAAAVVLSAYAELVWPAMLTPAVSHSSFPPLRPPRSIL